MGKAAPPSLCMLPPNWEAFLVQTLLKASGRRGSMCILRGMAIVLRLGPLQHWLPGVVSGRQGLTNGCASLWVSFLPIMDTSFTFFTSWCVILVDVPRSGIYLISVFLFSATGKSCEEHINLVEREAVAETHRAL